MSTTRITTNRTNATATRVVAPTLFERLTNTGGRFFGLYLKSGECINAQYRSQSDRYLMVYDRNRVRNRRILKTQVAGASV
jgi:hypothetical protein